MYIFVTLDLLLPIDHDIQKRKKTKTDFFRVIISEGRGFKYLNSDLINVLKYSSTLQKRDFNSPGESRAHFILGPEFNV